MTSPAANHDFDFLLGTWHRQDRRLRPGSSGSAEWQEYEGTSVVRPLWDGRGNFEEYQADAPDGPAHAVSLHLYNPRTRQWNLSWADRQVGRLGPPAIGEFKNGRGEFLSFEECDGRVNYLRLVWTDVSPSEAGFEQAVSRDGGKTWETNWVMRFLRVAEADTAPSQLPSPKLASDDGPDEVHGFDFLHGQWRVHNRKLRRPLTGSTEWYEFEGRSTERPFWNSEGNLEEYEGDSPDGKIRGLALRLYNRQSRQWSIHWSNSALGTLDRPMLGGFRNGRGEFYNMDQLDGGREILVRFLWTSSGHDTARWEQSYSDDGGRTWERNWIMDFSRDAVVDAVAPKVQAGCCPVVELRQYTLHPGQRESLISLFDREFVETQEATGMRVIAQFRDIDRPDVFTWLRGFPDMPSRAASLSAFYGGPVWAAHRDSANATMISSDNVRLLRPVDAESGFVLAARPGPGATTIPPGLVVATIYTLSPAAAEAFPAFFEGTLAPRLKSAGGAPFAVFQTEPSPNTFPRLPVREGEHAFVWFARFSDVAAYDRYVAALVGDRAWGSEAQPELERRLRAPVEIWRLTPTARSRPLRSQ